MIIVTVAVLSIILLGFLGLSIDLGRVYITKGELQNYADAAAFAAALRLNGLQSGIDNASAAVVASPNKWNFATEEITSAQRTVEFASSKDGPWHTTPTGLEIAQDAFVRVAARVSAPLLFMPAVRGGDSQYVQASAVAGKVLTSSVGPNNMVPMAPLAPTPSDTNTFGFEVGQTYALRWSSNIGNNGNPPSGSTCAGDLALGTGDNSTIARQRDRDPERGWWGSSSGSDLSEWIEEGYPYTLSIGSTILTYDGTKNGRKAAMENRVNSDTDHLSTTYSQYENNVANGLRVGNGRRLVAVPVIAGSAVSGNGNGNGNANNGNGNNGNGNGGGSGTPQTVLGFAAFFLHDLTYDDTNGNESFCATYVGSYTQGANAHSGGGNAGVAKLRLVQ